MEVIVAGCGHTGAAVARLLAEEGHQVTVMDTDEESFRRLTRDLDIQAVVGDGTQEADLGRAGIHKAALFLALTGQDSRNALAGQKVRHRYCVPHVICRIHDPLAREMYQELGIQTFDPGQSFADSVVESLGA